MCSNFAIAIDSCRAVSLFPAAAPKKREAVISYTLKRDC
jgi:hypothetical protein